MAVFFDRRFHTHQRRRPEEVPGTVEHQQSRFLLGTNPFWVETFVAEDGNEGQPRVVVISYASGSVVSAVILRASVGRSFLTSNRQPSSGHAGQTLAGTFKRERGEQTCRHLDPVSNRERIATASRALCFCSSAVEAGVSMDQAKSEMDAIGVRLAQQYPEFNTNWASMSFPYARNSPAR